MNILLLIPIVIIGLPIIGAIFQAIATARDKRNLPPPGQLTDAGAHRLHLHVTGTDTGKPAVILEAGMASFSSNFVWVQQELEQVTRVVAYDRAGLGWSDSGPKPRDAQRSATPRTIPAVSSRAHAEREIPRRCASRFQKPIRIGPLQ